MPEPILLNLDVSSSANITAIRFFGDGSGLTNITTTNLPTPRTIAATGDATWSVSFDGTNDVSGVLTLANSGVTAGTYTKLTVDSKGRVTAGALLQAADLPAHTHAITDITNNAILVKTTDTGTVTNTMLAGSIANAKLANSSFTLNGVSVSLGGTATIPSSTSGTLTIGSYLTGGSFNGSSNVTIAADASTTNTASKLVARDASGNFSAGIITASLNGLANNISQYVVNQDVGTTSTPTFGTVYAGNVQATGTAPALDIRRNGTANMGALRYYNNQLAKYDWTIYPESGVTNADLIFGATSQQAMRVSQTGLLTVNGGIANVRLPRLGVYSHLSNPSVEEIAIFPQQMANKIRFDAPYLQEQSTDGVTWATSTRATAQQLIDMTIGEGQTLGSPINIIPVTAVGDSGYYRLTWDAQTGGYRYLNCVYAYMVTAGANITIKVEAYNNASQSWTQIVTGTANGWPGHVYIPHNELAVYTDVQAWFHRYFRITFHLASALYSNYNIQLYALEWAGGYPAHLRRNLHTFDSTQNVYWPAGVYGSKFVDRNDTTYYLDPSDATSSLVVAGATNQGGNSVVFRAAAGDTGYTVNNSSTTGTPGITFYQNGTEYGSIRRNNSGVTNPGRIVYSAFGTGASHYFNAATTIAGNLTVTGTTTLSNSLTVPGIVSSSGITENSAVDGALELTSSDNNWKYIAFNWSGGRRSYFGINGTGYPIWGSDLTDTTFNITGAGVTRLNVAGGYLQTSGFYAGNADAGAGTIGGSATHGASIKGSGTTSDVTLYNKTGAVVLTVPTGTTNVTVAGNLSAANVTATNFIGRADKAKAIDNNATPPALSASAAPRAVDRGGPGSIYLYDNYNYNNNDGATPNWPINYGTIVEIYGRSGHQIDQLHFGNDRKIHHRTSFYNETTWTAFQKIITSDEISVGNTANKVVLRDASGNFSAGTITANLLGTATNVTGTVAIANGGTGATTASGARTNLGATTTGSNLFTLTDPSAIRFIRVNADNTVSALSADDFRTAIGAGSGGGSVSSVSGTGTVNGITLTGTVTSTGSLTLGGALTGVNLESQVTGTLPVANGGTGATGRQSANTSIANWGQLHPHATFTDFNSVPNTWGFTHVYGTGGSPAANAPHANSSQWYRARISLGSEYNSPGSGAGTYWMEFAMPRFSGSSYGNLYFRTNEAGTTGAWYGVRSAYAESAGLVADGVYLSTAQTIAGQKTFSNNILTTVSHAVSQDRFLQFLSDNGTSTYGANYGYALSAAGDPYGRIRRRHEGTLTDVITFPTSSGNVTIHSATNATDKDTGALVVEGGIGVEKDVVVGGAIYAQTYANAKGQQVQFSGRGLNGGWTAGIHFHHANTNNSATFVHHPATGDLLLYTTTSTANYTDPSNLALKVETSRDITFYANTRTNGNSTLIGNLYLGSTDTYIYRATAGVVGIAGGTANRLDVNGSTSAGIGFRQTGSRDFFITAESSELRVSSLTATSPFVVNAGTPMRIRDTTAADTTLAAGALVVSGGMAVVSSLYTGGTYFTTADTNAIVTGLSIANSNTGNAARSRLTLASGASTVTLDAYGSGHATRANQTILASSNGSISFSPSGVETIKAAFNKVEILADTASAATNSGALVVTGGLGVGGAVNAGGAITAAGQIKTRSTSAGTIDIITEHAGTATDARSRVVALNTNGYQIGFTFQGTNFTQNGPFRTNRGAIVGSFDISYLSGQHLFWYGDPASGGDNTSPTNATQMFSLVGVTKVASLYFDTQSNDSSTGALTVTGGVGIAKNLNVGGSSSSFGNILENCSVTINSNNISTLSLKDSGGTPREYLVRTSSNAFEVVDNTSSVTAMSLAPVTGNAVFSGTLSSGGYIYPGNDANFYIRGTQSGNGLIRGNTLSLDAATTFFVRNGSSTGNFFEVSTSTGSTTSGTMVGGRFVVSGGTETYAYYDQSNGAYYHSPGAMVRKDSASAVPGEMPATLVLYNRNGTALTGSKLVFAANETTESTANPVALAAIVGQKVSGVAGNWAHGRLRFYVQAGGSYNEVLTLDSGKNAAFTGPVIMGNNVAQYWTDGSGNNRRSILVSAGNDYYFGPIDGGWNAALTHIRAGTSMYLSVNGASGTLINAVVVNSTGTVTLAKDPAADRDAITRVWSVSRGQNLVTNGSGLMANNYNFSGFAFDATQTHGGGGSFMTAASYSSFISDEFMPVDPEKNYRMVVWARSGQDGGVDYNPANLQFAGVAVYDIDLNSIQPFHYAKYPGSTDTTLTATLNVGDTSFTVANATGWAGAGTENYMRTLAWYGYTNAKGYTYPNYTYTRNVSWYQSSSYISSGTWGTNGITGNTITLTAPWPGPAIPAGTAVRNSTSGGTYKYIVYGAATVPNNWSRYEGFIGGLDTTASQNGNQFPYGTSYVRLLFLTNYHAIPPALSGNKIRYSDITFSESSSANLEAASASSPGVVSTVSQSFSGAKTFLTSVYTPVVYDNDNTAYYSNPAGTSNFATLAVTGKVVVNGSPTGSGNGDVGASRSSTTGAYYLGTDGSGYLYRESSNTMVLRAGTDTTLKLGATGAAYFHYIRGATAGGAIQFKCDPLTNDRYLSLGSVDNLTNYAEALRLTGTSASFTGTATVAGNLSVGSTATVADYTAAVESAAGGAPRFRLHQSGVRGWNIINRATSGTLAFNDGAADWLQIAHTTGATTISSNLTVTGNLTAGGNNAVNIIQGGDSGSGTSMLVLRSYGGTTKVVFRGDGDVNIINGTTSNGASSGALIVNGGTGIAGRLNVGEYVTAANYVLGSGGPSVASALGSRSTRQGLVFDGTSQATISNGQIVGTTDFTIAAWISRSGSDLSVPIWGPNGSIGVAVRATTITLDKPGTGTVATWTYTVASNKNCFVVIKRSGTTATAFVDGVSLGDVTGVSTDFTVAYNSVGLTSYSIGRIATPLVYNRGLSAAEVLALYESGTPAQADYNNANFTSLNTANWVDVSSSTFSGASATGFTVSRASGTSYIVMRPSPAAVYRPFTRFRVSGTLTLNSGKTVLPWVYVDGTGATQVPVTAAGAFSVEITTPSSGGTINTVVFTAAGDHNYTVSSVSVVPLGLLLAPDANQRGDGLAWYDTSGNNATITLPSLGVSWAVRANPDLRVAGTGIFGAYAGGAYTAGDIIARRSSTTGAIRFGDSAGTYLYFDGGKYEFGGTPGLDVGGQITGKTGGVFYRGTNNSGSTLLALKRADGTTNLLTATDSADGLTLKLGYTGLGTTSNWVSLFGTGNDGAGLQINSGQTAAVGQIVFSNEAKARWQIQRDPSVTEAGSNTGSDFKISAYNDAGNTVLSTPFTISRSTGTTTLTGLTVTGAVNAGSIATTGKTTFGFSASSQGTATLDANYGLVLRGYTGAISDLTLTQDGGTIVMRNAVGSSNVFFNGLVKVGMTGTIDSRLHVYEDTNADVSNGLTIEQDGAGDAVAAFLLTGVQRWSVGVDNSDADKFKIGTGSLGSADKVTLDTSGNLTATGNITAYYSDERLKTRLGKIENAIEKVKTLSGFYFAPNDTAMALGYQKKVDVGVSAQEVKAILPEVIAPAPIDPQYMTVRYEKLIPLLIEAIKEQQEQIETLKQMVAALTAK